MDYAAFLYLNPELCLSRNISTVEGAKFYLDALSAAELADVHADLAIVPADFEPAVYVADGGLQLDVSLLDSVLRAQSINEGLSQEQVQHNQAYADSLVQDLTLAASTAPDTLHFTYAPFMTTANVMLNDSVRLLVDDADFYKATVTAVDYNARSLSLAAESSSLPLPATASKYRLYSVLVSDVRRIAIINYVRMATNRTARTSFDPEFNLRLYQLLYPDSRLLDRDTAYVDYLGRQNTQDFRVGKEPDLLVNNELFVWPPLRLSDVEITGSATFLGEATYCNAISFLDDMRIGGDLAVSGDASVAGQMTADAVAVSNGLAVGGPTSLGDALDVAGAATLSNGLWVAGNTTLGDALAVSGRTTLSNDLSVAGNTTLGDALSRVRTYNVE